MRLSFVVVAFAACLAGCQQARPPYAQLLRAGEHVTVHRDGADVAVAAPMSLFEEDVISSGDGSQATIMFFGRSMLTLPGGSVVALKRPTVGTASFGATLVSGGARVVSEGHGILLGLAGKFGTLEVGQGNGAANMQPCSLEVDAAGNARALGGEVELHKPDGTSVVLHADPNAPPSPPDVLPLPGVVASAVVDTVNRVHLRAEPTLDPLRTESAEAAAAQSAVAPAPTAETSAVANKPLTCTLQGTGKTTLVRASAAAGWRVAPKRVDLAPGTQVWAKKAEARVQCSERSFVTLHNDGQLQLTSAATGEGIEEVSYAVLAGGVTASAARSGPKDRTTIKHVMSVADHAVTITPTRREALADVTVSKSAAALTMRHGRAKVDDNVVVEAGSSIDMPADGTISAPRLAPPGRITLHARSSAIVYHVTRVPPITFVWTGDVPGSEWLFELGNNAADGTVLIAEDLTRSSFTVDTLEGGRYFWRITSGQQTALGLLEVLDESQSDCPECQATHTLNDDQKPVVVKYQQALPAITLHWNAAAAASGYRLQVQNAAGKVLFDETLNDTHHGFAAGFFLAGAYTWGVTPIGAQAAGSSRNSLQVTFDSAIKGLIVRHPAQPLSVTSSDSIPISGETDLATSVSLNGKHVDVDPKGHFRETFALQPGLNPLTFRAVGQDAVERYYLRDVQRR